MNAKMPFQSPASRVASVLAVSALALGLAGDCHAPGYPCPGVAGAGAPAGAMAGRSPAACPATPR